ncbi:hypothetical protein GQ44DRAFT_686800 [Phaeosphaeriaceae sp. PMI808]|nr:hypothetical protein GQ44DRAFT_686800 [Phaeosphaeriaceae sp. PMI808]
MPVATITIVAVSRAQPATHNIHSQPTLTSIVRSPSSTPLVLGPEYGIESHRSAIHDAQVYALFADHYDYWTSRLGIERATWGWSFWGENLTIQSSCNLDERRVHLGDRWAFSKNGSKGEGVRILRVPGLQNMNKQIISRKLSLINEKESEKLGRWAGWRDLEIIKVVDETPDVKSFYLAATNNSSLASYLPGQFLTIKLPSGQIRCWSISSWTPSSTTSPPSFYCVTVKKREGASAYLHSKCLVGNHLLVRSPSGSFVPDWSREFPPRQIYISAGIGITPISCMLQAHLSHDTLRRTPAILIHIARNSKQDISLYRKEFVGSTMLRIVKFYTQPIDGVDVQGKNYDHKGRPSTGFFTQLLAPSYEIDPLQITPIELPGTVSAAYVCGPPTFVDFIRAQLEAAKIPPVAIRSETFSSDMSALVNLSMSLDEDVPGESLVTFHPKAKDVKWKKNEALSLLQIAEREQLEPEFGCRTGDCGVCEMKIVKGEARVLRNAGKEAQEASGKVGTMIRVCCSIPASTALELEF